MKLTTLIRRYLFQRSMRKHKIPLRLWHQSLKTMPIMRRYNRQEKVRLRLLASDFLVQKTLTPVRGFVITDEMSVVIATQAAILLLGLENPEEVASLDWLHNWQQLIVYPTPFYTARKPYFNPQGIFISSPAIEAGEAHYQGGIIIDWQDAQPHPLHKQANQVLMHEMAHKLDMLDGGANGHPPLHANMSHQVWFDALNDAYNTLKNQVRQGQKTAINNYAATNPAEFFAVATEYFFESPQTLHQHFPDVYHQLALFYRQDPLTKI